MKKKFIVSLIILILLIGGLNSANAASLKKENIQTDSIEYENSDIQLSFSKNALEAANLDIAKIVTSDSLSDYDYEFIKSEKINIKISDCSLHQTDYGKYFIDIHGLQLTGSTGEPILPMKSITFELPKNAKIVDVILTNAYYVEIENRLRIASMPEPFRLGYSQEEAEQYFENKIKPKTELYGSNNFFPGTALRYQSGKTRDKQIAIVQLLPIQYIPRTGELVLITQGDINILYEKNEENTQVSSLVSTAENIIITSEELYNQALELKIFHDGQGTETKVVNTSWIKENYEESKDPNYPGYKDDRYKDTSVVVEYDYSLAKKIISYLNDSHPNLKYVTLLGNAKQVPPSYYMYENTGEFSGYPIGWSWIPTDLFYASPDLDLIPNYYIGRIPVRNADEATHVINKIKNWNASSDFFENVHFTGGTTFNSPYIFGEAIVVDMINKGYVDGSNVSTYYQTDGKFTPDTLKEVFENESGLFYHLGHGSGITLDAGPNTGDMLWPEDMLGLDKNDKSHVFISASCLNGAYDTQVVDISSSTLYNFSKSFAESVLLSDSAGICYIGSSRVTWVGIVLNLEKGQLKIYQHRYFSKMAECVLQSYQKGADTLGNLTTNAMIEYQKASDMSEHWDIYTLLEFTLLGDPALKLPEKPPVGSPYTVPNSTSNNPISYQRVSENGSIPIHVNNEVINITSNSDAPEVEIKIIDSYSTDDLVIERRNLETSGGSVDFDFTSNVASMHLVRTITPDKKEGWLYFYAARVVDDDYDSSTPGYGETKWSTIQEAVNNFENTNSNRKEMIYVFNGTYKENIKMQRGAILLGEDKHLTIIDAKGLGDVIDLRDGSYEISGFTITNSGKLMKNAGVAIRPGSFYLVIYNCIIDNNKNGIYVHRNAKGVIGILYNTISNSTYGININAKRGVVFSNVGVQIDTNIIRDNTYGVFLKNTGFVIVNLRFGTSGIIYNTISNNRVGVLLSNCKRLIISENNFINNLIHSTFYKSTKNWYIFNYWDNWRGLEYGDAVVFMPKKIFGTRGPIFGLIPRPARDLFPAGEPYYYQNPFEFDN